MASITANEITTVKMLMGALRTASDMVHVKDPETFSHLQRMAQYARLIAIGLAESVGKSARWYEKMGWIRPVRGDPDIPG